MLAEHAQSAIEVVCTSFIGVFDQDITHDKSEGDPLERWRKRQGVEVW